MLGVAGSNLKMVKFFMQHLWMLHDVVVVWPGSSNNVGPGMRTSSIFNSQHVSTRCNKVAQRVQHVAPDAICCVQMLWSFGRSLQKLGQQCWDMLRWDVAIVWPGLETVLNLIRSCSLKPRQICELAGVKQTISSQFFFLVLSYLGEITKLLND